MTLLQLKTPLKWVTVATALGSAISCQWVLGEYHVEDSAAGGAATGGDVGSDVGSVGTGVGSDSPDRDSDDAGTRATAGSPGTGGQATAGAAGWAVEGSGGRAGAPQGTGGSAAAGGATGGAGDTTGRGGTGTAGESADTGGSTATGGATGAAGEPPGTGGSTATGGTTAAAGDTSGGTADTGGSTATGGATAAAGDASGGAGTGATGGTADTGGTGGAAVSRDCTGASGVAVLSVPLTAIGQGQRYNYQNYDGIGSYDLRGATLNIVACAPHATAGNLHVYFTTPDRDDSAAFDVALSSLTTFTTISIPVPSASDGFDPETVMLTRVEVEAGDGFGTSWEQPETVVLIDRIYTSNGPFNDTFDRSISPLEHSGARELRGATITWADE